MILCRRIIWVVMKMATDCSSASGYGNLVIAITPTASAVDGITITNAASANDERYDNGGLYSTFLKYQPPHSTKVRVLHDQRFSRICRKYGWLFRQGLAYNVKRNVYSRPGGYSTFDYGPSKQ